MSRCKGQKIAVESREMVRFMDHQDEGFDFGPENLVQSRQEKVRFTKEEDLVASRRSLYERPQGCGRSQCVQDCGD